MTATIILADHEQQLLDDNERTMKRRPQHEGFENNSLLPSMDYSPTRQDIRANRCRGRRRHSCLSPLFLWVALMFACCQNHKFSIPSVLAIRLRDRTKYQTNRLQRQQQQQQRRSLQNGGNSGSSSALTIDYLDLPKSLWTSKVPGDEFLEGNAIVVSPFDRDILYATNRAGDFRVISASNGSTINTVSPSPRTLTENGATTKWSLYSNSGMTFGKFPVAAPTVQTTPKDGNSDNDGGYNDYLNFLINNGIEQETTQESRFAVYSIVDEAPIVSRFLPKTRVVCVSIPEHKVLWESAGLPGTPKGSPLVYYADEATNTPNKKDDKDGDDDTGGMYIVLTHNSILLRPDNTTRTTGHLTVLDPTNGHVKWTESEWSREEVPKGYGPPQVSHNPVLGGGNSGGSPDNKNDVIIWTSSDQEGRGNVGNLYSFQMKSSAELESETKNEDNSEIRENDPFEIRVLKRVRWNSIARPATNRDGTNLFIGMTGNAVRGWNGIAKFNDTANWASQLVPLDGGGSDALSSQIQTYPDDIVVSTAPVLSADEERLFVVTVRNETVCLDAKTGARMWAAKTRKPSPIVSEPKASPDDQRLYVVMSRDGKAFAVNQEDGKVLWTFGCDEKSSGSKCFAPSISADFDVSGDGTVMYYGGADGRIVALTLGTIRKGKSPSISTTISIEYDGDDRGPLEFDRKSNVDGVQSSNNNNQGTGLKIAGTLVAIIVSLSVAMISVVYVVRAKGIDLRDLQNYRFPRYGSSKDNGGKRHSHVVRLDGPDMYEDQIIANLSEDDGVMEQEFNTLWVDPTHSDPKYYINDDDESPTADRLSILLGTSNRIAPISDNFGFGQAVLI